MRPGPEGKGLWVDKDYEESHIERQAHTGTKTAIQQGPARHTDSETANICRVHTITPAHTKERQDPDGVGNGSCEDLEKVGSRQRGWQVPGSEDGGRGRVG